MLSRMRVAVAERKPHDLGQCSHLYMGSLGGNTSAMQAHGT
jgi:hypothetical protein